VTKPELSLSVQYASTAGNLPARAQVRRWVLAALEHSAAITLRIVDADEAQALNRDYRHKDYATNVLTFEYGEIGRDDKGGGILGGDIVLCAPVVEKEAAEQGKNLAHHYAHLAIHGTLHLQGYDHEAPADAVIMETREAVILKRFKIPNPYLSRDD
jgi:probable rRNA maturation factor